MCGKITPTPCSHIASPATSTPCVGSNSSTASASCPGAAWICQSKSPSRTVCPGTSACWATKRAQRCAVSPKVRASSSHVCTCASDGAGTQVRAAGHAACSAPVPPQWSLCRWVWAMSASGWSPSACRTCRTVSSACLTCPVSISAGASPRHSRLLDDSQPRSCRMRFSGSANIRCLKSKKRDKSHRTGGRIPLNRESWRYAVHLGDSPCLPCSLSNEFAAASSRP